ncbi:MAG: septum formation initiator family protein [Thiomargarita sp.]|nr:septum formation initiator family protein [Thiomargarita sp.]
MMLSILLINLQYQLWYANQDHTNLKQQIDSQQEKNAMLMSCHQKLEKKVVYLKQNSEAMEEYARMELGMIKQNEVFYQIIE